MRVGVTGANGYVGRAIVRRLLAGGHAVTALVHRAGAEPPPGVAVIVGDIRDDTRVADLANASDAVVHAAAYVHRSAETSLARRECFGVNEGGTRLLAEAMASTGRRPRLVFVSSTAVYGATSTDAREDGPTHPATAYGESKLAAEGHVRAGIERGGIGGLVLRPAVVYGPGAPGNTARLLRLIRRGFVPRVANAANRKSMVHVDDFADIIAAALSATDALDGNTYNVAGDAVSIDTLVSSLARGAGLGARWIPLPAAVAVAAASVSRLASRASGGRLPDLSRAFDAFSGEATVDARAVAAELGARFRPTAPALEAVAREAQMSSRS